MDLGELVMNAQQITGNAGLAYNNGENSKATEHLRELEALLFAAELKPTETETETPEKAAEPEKPEAEELTDEERAVQDAVAEQEGDKEETDQFVESEDPGLES